MKCDFNFADSQTVRGRVRASDLRPSLRIRLQVEVPVSKHPRDADKVPVSGAGRLPE